MNPFTQATEEDYSPDQILNYLMHSNPNLKKTISKAYDAGYQAQQIINFLSSVSNSRQKLQPLPSGSSQQAVHARNTLEDQLNLQKGVNTGLSLATGLGAGGLLRNALPKAASMISRRGLGQAAKTVAAAPTTAIEAAAPAAIATEKAAEALPFAAIKGLKADFDALKLTSKIESLLTHQQPEVISGMLQKQVTDDQKNNLEEKYSKSFPSLVKDYADYYLSKTAEIEKKPTDFYSPENIEALEQFEKAGEMSYSPDELVRAPASTFQQRNPDLFPENESALGWDERMKLQRERQKLSEKEYSQKERLVALPDGGVGKLLEERQGIGSVELPNGQIRRRKLADMDVEPPELEKQVVDLIKSIPEAERSSVLAFGSFTPDAEFEMNGENHKGSFLGVQFHNGDFYMYPNVTQDQFDRVVSKSVNAKTSGENPWHAWMAGKGSRGAGMHELIKELEKEFGKNFIKFKASGGYDYFKRVREIVKKVERERKSKKS
jgi:hypothetical protein